MKTLEDLAREATGYDTHADDGAYAFTAAELARFATLVRAQALDEAAAVCDGKERRKWEILTGGGKLEGFGPLDCAFAIRALKEST